MNEKYCFMLNLVGKIYSDKVEWLRVYYLIPEMEGLDELHDSIVFYLALMLFSLVWGFISIVVNNHKFKCYILLLLWVMYCTSFSFFFRLMWIIFNLALALVTSNPMCFLDSYNELLEITSCPMNINDILNPTDEPGPSVPSGSARPPEPSESGSSQISTKEVVISKLEHQLEDVRNNKASKGTSIYSKMFGDNSINNEYHLILKTKLSGLRYDYTEKVINGQNRMCYYGGNPTALRPSIKLLDCMKS